MNVTTDWTIPQVIVNNSLHRELKAVIKKKEIIIVESLTFMFAHTS